MVTALLVVTRVVANPVSNVFQKQLAQRGASPVFIIAATHALLTLIALPILAATPVSQISSGFWTSMGICIVLAVAGNVLLVYALRAADLSVLGPINSYKAVISLVLGIFLLGEVPSALGLTGVFLILAGSYFVADRAEGQPRRNALLDFFRNPGVQLRLGALAFSATEAVFLKRAIVHATPMITFLFWCILPLPVAAAAAGFLPRGSAKLELRRCGQNLRTYLWLALTTGLMQGTTLLMFERLQVGYSLALFQLSSILNVFLGHHYFSEPHFRRRLIGSAIMVLGAMLIVCGVVR